MTLIYAKQRTSMSTALISSGSASQKPDVIRPSTDKSGMAQDPGSHQQLTTRPSSITQLYLR